MKHKNLLSFKDFKSLQKPKKVTKRTQTSVDVLENAKAIKKKKINRIFTI